MSRLLVIAVAFAWFACSGEPEPEVAPAEEASGALVVHATSYPLAYFAERVGGSLVEVEFPAPAGLDPAHWNPDPETIARAQRADLLLRSGAGDPGWLDQASLHRDRVVDTTALVRGRLIEQPSALHQHGPEGEHSHGAWAGTTWLDPTLAEAQAQAVFEALLALRPAHEETLRASFEGLAADLAGLDARLADAARALGDAPLLYSHPVYTYLQARYGLNGQAVVWEPDARPDASQWRGLDRMRETHDARAMLWEAEPLSEVAAALAERGVATLVVSPCANRSSEGDWLDVMRENARVLERLPARLAEMD